MRFRYEAMDSTGLVTFDAIEAESSEEACSLIRQQGLFVTKITEIGYNAPRFTQQQLVKMSWPSPSVLIVVFVSGVVTGFILSYIIQPS